MLQSGSLAPGGARSRETPAGILELGGRDWIVFRLKALEAQVPAALDLVKRILVEADLNDLVRLEDLVREFRNDLDSSLAPGGHSFAASRAGRRFSRSRAIDELWGGITQLEFMHKLAEGEVSELAAGLVRIRARLVSQAGLMVNLTGSAAAIATATEIIGSSFSDFGAPRPRSAKAAESAHFFELVDSDDRGDEAWSSASLQVGFGALALPAAPFAGPEQAAELVLAHRLSTGALWEEIRMKGGAYGAFAHPDGLEPLFTLATYRDPAPARSLDAFTAALLAASKERIEDDELEKAIIGTYSKEVRPRSPSEKGLSDFMRYLYGIEPLARRNKLESIVDMTAESVANAAGRLYEAKREGYIAVLAGKTEAGKAAAALGAPVRNLPL
jgi:Zn-dependent M16 (insulinase) family peptidase